MRFGHTISLYNFPIKAEAIIFKTDKKSNYSNSCQGFVHEAENHTFFMTKSATLFLLKPQISNLVQFHKVYSHYSKYENMTFYSSEVHKMPHE